MSISLCGKADFNQLLYDSLRNSRYASEKRKPQEKLKCLKRWKRLRKTTRLGKSSLHQINITSRARRERSHLSQASMKVRKPREPTNASAVANRYFAPRRNIIPAQAGPVFTLQLVKAL